MAINNYKCEDCEHELVCKIKDKLDLFHSDARKQLGVEITINGCESWVGVVSEED